MKQLSNQAIEYSHFETLYPDTTRFKEIEKILSFVKEGHSCQLIGVPGTGRSSLLGLLPYNKNVRIKHLGENQKWFHFVLLNFSEIRKKPLLDATKFMFLGLLDSLRERKMDKEYAAVNTIFKEGLGLNDEMVLFQGLKKTIDFLAVEKELTIVFLFDRFEEYVPTVTSDFFANLRILRNRAKYRFSIVFSTNRPLDDMLEPIFFADFYEFMAGKIVHLPLLDKPGLDFRISYLEKITGKKVDKKVLAEIMKLTGGHGSLTRHCLEAILAINNQKLASSSELIEFFLKQKPIRSVLFGIWNSLNPSEQNILSLIGFGSYDISYLENIGLIKNNQLTILLLKEYVKEKMKTSETPEKIVFDQNSNEVKKGDLVISDKLTSSEFKLLQFFILNSEKVLDREGVIKTVWEDMQSTAGVTDQALDQLVFRLRKKIEADPNNPTHIQTIKGRGFRFTA
ncbi:MAG: winged helix-turn-helix domain-containing protein [Patescibacteria group bacterium]|nr:winged helix-turn-helix domain-containing protein [Patescibacteria group bacterium]